MLTEIRQAFYRKSEDVSKLDFSKLHTQETSSPRNSTQHPHHNARKLTLPETLNINVTPNRLVAHPSRTHRSQVGGSVYFPNASPGLYSQRSVGKRLKTLPEPIVMPKLEQKSSKTPFRERKDLREKKLILWDHATNLKLKLEKFQKNGPEDTLVTSKTDVNRIFKFFKALEEAEPDLNGLMDPIIKALSNAIYVNFKLAETYFQDAMLQGSEELQNMYETLQSKEIPYYGLCSEFSKALDRLNSEEPVLDKVTALKISNMEKLIEEKTLEVSELKAELEQTVPKQEFQVLNSRYTSLEKLYKTLHKKHEDLQAKNKDLEGECNTLKYRYDKQVSELDKKDVTIQGLEHQIETLKKQNSASNDSYQVVQGRIRSLKDIMDQVIVRLTLLKKDVDQLRVFNEELSEENRKLHVRAAGGFEGLTPRPNYKQIAEEKQLEFNLFNPTGKKPLKSTADIMNGLLDKVQALQQRMKDYTNANYTPRKGNDSVRLHIQRAESGGKSDPQSPHTAFDLTPRVMKNKKDKFGKHPLKLNLLSTQLNQSMKEGSENNSPNNFNSNLSSKRASLSFSVTDPKKSDDSPLSVNDDLSTAALPNNHNKYAKSAFSKQNENGGIIASPRNAINEFGLATLNETRELLSHVAQAKLDLKDLE